MELEPIQYILLDHDNDLVDLTLTAIVKDAHGKTTQKSEVIHTNEKHPFLTKEKGFVPVSQLKPGMHVRQADGSYGVVTKLVIVPGAMWMYNLTVAQDHTYTVGTARWIVHNTDPCGGGDPSLEGLGKLQNQEIEVTQDGINQITEHLSRPELVQDDGSMYPQNVSAINRLQQAYDAGRKISGGDASFYTHELFEKGLMDQGVDYDTAHAAALNE